MTMYHYTPSDVSFTIAGTNISGFGQSGEFISIERETPLFDHRRSMDGAVEIVSKQHSTYLLTLTLAQSSQSNEYLDALQKFQQKRNKKVTASNLVNNLYGNVSSLIGKLPLIIKNSHGNAFFFATDFWIEKLPKVSYGSDLTDRTWQMRCFNALHVIAGQDTDSEILEAISAFNTVSEGIDLIQGLF